MTTAIESALDGAELEKIKDEQDTVTRQFLRAEIDRKTWESELGRLDGQAGVAIFDSLEDFATALKLLGFSDDDVRTIVQIDEQPHYEKAIGFGLKTNPQLQLLRNSDGSLDLYPSTRVDFPNELTDEQVRIALRTIIEAPDVLSPRDKSQLGKE